MSRINYNDLMKAKLLKLDINDINLSAVVEPKCTKCGRQLQQVKGKPATINIPNLSRKRPSKVKGSSGVIGSASVVTSGAISFNSLGGAQLHDAIIIVLQRNEHRYSGSFCGWDCMIEWLNDDLLPQMALDVVSE